MKRLAWLFIIVIGLNGSLYIGSSAQRVRHHRFVCIAGSMC